MNRELYERIRIIEHDTLAIPSCRDANGTSSDLSKTQTRAICALSLVLLTLADLVDSGSADRKLDLILARLDALGRQESHHMQELDDLTAEVKANTAAEQSAIVLINGIAARIAAAGVDPAALAALTADLKTNSDALAAAVVANTPPTA